MIFVKKNISKVIEDSIQLSNDEENEGFAKWIKNNYKDD